MPSFSSVRRTGKWDCSTSWMISSFSQAGYLMPHPPHPRSRFFEQTVFESQFGHDLLQSRRFAAKVLDLVRGRGPCRVASQPLLAGFQEVLRPTIIQVLDDPFATAQLGDALLAAEAHQDDADLLFCRELPACRPPDVFHDLCRRFLGRPGFLSHLRSLKGYDEPEIIPSSTRPICLMGADVGQQITTIGIDLAKTVFQVHA